MFKRNEIVHRSTTKVIEIHFCRISYIKINKKSEVHYIIK